MRTTLRQMTALAVMMAITAGPASAQTPASSAPAQAQKRDDKQKAEPVATPQQPRETAEDLGVFKPVDPDEILADPMRELAEDLEVFKAILHETLQREYKERKWLLTWPAIRQEPSPGDVGQPLAARLPRYGVVFQLEAPLPGKAPEPVKDEKDAETGYPTRWERTRRNLRGETPKSPGSAAGRGAEGRGPEDSIYPNVDAFDVKVWDGAEGRGLDDSIYPSFGQPNKDRRVQVGPSRHQVVQAILGVLAEIGHHIRHLKAAERPVAGGVKGNVPQEYVGDRLTVAVTFRKPQKSRPRMGYGMGGGMMGPGMGSSMMQPGYGGLPPDSSGANYGGGVYGAGAGFGYQAAGEESYSGSAGYAPGASAENSSTGEAAKAETTGDLHMRQGKTSKAVEAYEKALRLRAKMLPGWKDIADLETAVYEYDQWETKWHRVLRGGTDTKTLAVLQKLARAHLSANNYEKARHVLSLLEQAEELAKQGARTKSKEAKEIPVPARLVVTVMKADCEAVAEGKISRKQFDDRAYIEYFDPRKPAEEEKKPAEQAEEEQDEEKVSERGNQAGRAYALAGLIDIDGDGRSDVDRLREIVRQEGDGGTVNSYIDEQGRRRGNAIGTGTDLLVIGAATRPDSADGNEQRQRRKTSVRSR